MEIYVLVYGYSTVVSEILIKASFYWDKQFTCIILEGHPDASAVQMAKAIQTYAQSIPTMVVLYSAMGYVMEV